MIRFELLGSKDEARTGQKGEPRSQQEPTKSNIRKALVLDEYEKLNAESRELSSNDESQIFGEETGLIYLSTTNH